MPKTLHSFSLTWHCAWKCMLGFISSQREHTNDPVWTMSSASATKPNTTRFQSGWVKWAEHGPLPVIVYYSWCLLASDAQLWQHSWLELISKQTQTKTVPQSNFEAASWHEQKSNKTVFASFSSPIPMLTQSELQVKSLCYTVKYIDSITHHSRSYTPVHQRVHLWRTPTCYTCF